MARPKKRDPKTGKIIYDPSILAKKIAKYTEEAKPYPTITQFLYNNKLSKSRFYELVKINAELQDAVNMLHTKAEYLIEYGTAMGNIQITFGIFKLKQKQFGWTDKIDNDTDVKPVININIPNRTPEEIEEIEEIEEM